MSDICKCGHTDYNHWSFIEFLLHEPDCCMCVCQCYRVTPPLNDLEREVAR